MSVRRLVLGAVLAGGASSRFGSDKAMAVVGGRTLLDHAVAAIAPSVDRVVIIGRGDITDLPAAGLGPLGGIAAALDRGARNGFASVLTIGCDMVRVPGELIDALLRQAPACCTDAPVLGHWPVALADDLIARLRVLATAATRSGLPPGQAHDEARKEKALSVRRWAAGIGAVAIPSPAALANINTPADLAAL